MIFKVYYKNFLLIFALVILFVNPVFSCHFGIPVKLEKDSLETARFLSKKFCELNDAIPNLKPSDKLWVQEELKTKNTKRWLEVISTIEYALYKSKNSSILLCDKEKNLLT